jgi:hypothetical protein
MSYFTQYHYLPLIHSRPHSKSYHISSTCHNTAIPYLISDRRPRPCSSRCRDWTHRNPSGPLPKVGSDKGLNRVMDVFTIHRAPWWVVHPTAFYVFRPDGCQSTLIPSPPLLHRTYSIRVGTKYKSRLGPRTLIPRSRSFWR